MEIVEIDVDNVKEIIENDENKVLAQEKVENDELISDLFKVVKVESKHDLINNLIKAPSSVALTWKIYGAT